MSEGTWFDLNAARDQRPVFTGLTSGGETGVAGTVWGGRSFCGPGTISGAGEGFGGTEGGCTSGFVFCARVIARLFLAC